MVVS
ncbi:hypothetical protein RDI58_001050 [Solanum bulbocastanum]|jgi:predicted lactoylglutathione lyase